MNFFEHQDRARRNTTRLVFLFVLAVLLIVLAVDLVIATAAGKAGHPPIWGFSDSAWVAQNAAFLAWTSIAVLSFIGLATLYKTHSLGGGGGKVARSLGGERVTPDAKDPRLRRLLNVVEEMAIASGVPVPEVYLLGDEEGINAFASGFTPSDAALGVTRGTLERLSREELQGVIAHEFSHILNGDMRLNTHLLGLLFGILCIGLAGKGLLRGAFRGSRVRVSRSGKGTGSAALLLLVVGLALLLIGSIGVFFGRLIKAGVSRQREFLADASAVQFTRNPGGIAGALKKIGGFRQGSLIETARAEEVSHMLFGAGAKSLISLMATHPPIVERIRAIDPRFQAEELERLRAEEAAIAEMAAEHDTLPDALSSMARGLSGPLPEAAIAITPAGVSGGVGTLTPEHLRYAARLLSATPETVRNAAASPYGAGALIFALLLSKDDLLREKQLALIDKTLGETHGMPVRRLYAEAASLGPEFRLPLIDLSFPALRQCDERMRRRVHEVIDALISADQRIDPFEFALSRIARGHLVDAGRPRATGPLRRAPALARHIEEVRVLLSIMASLGHEDPVAARNAYDAGMHRLLGSQWPDYAPREPWAEAADRALEILDRVAMSGKRQLIEALVTTLSHDGRVTVEEGEILRAICETIHCPLPPLLAGPLPPSATRAPLTSSIACG